MPLHNGEGFRGSNVSDSPAATLPPYLPAARYFLTFKGNFASHPVRRRFAELHDPAAGIFMVDSTSAKASADDYYDLMFNTTFALAFVPRGDVEFSYRLAEAVYSGSIPVLVADDWIPPFSRLDNVIAVRFEEYGLELVEDIALDTVVPALKGVQGHRLEGMHRKARETCERHVQHVEVSITRWSAWLMVTEAVAMVRLAELLQEGFCTKNKTKSPIGPALTIQKPMCVHSMPMAVPPPFFFFS